MMLSFENELRSLGFSEKEAKVYLASLELGPSPVQLIAKKAGVNRATTYVMIESLKERGLVSFYLQGKRAMFVAASPDHLRHEISKEVRRAQVKQEQLESFLPKMSGIMSALHEHPNIQLFEGRNGLREVHEDILRHTLKHGSIDNIASVDDARKYVAFDEMHGHWDSLAKKEVKIRALYTVTGPDEEVPTQFRKLWQERRLPSDKFDFHGEIVIYGDRVAMFTYKGKIMASIVDSKEIAQTARVLFDLAWASAKG